MSTEEKTLSTGKKWILSLDSWAVVAAFAAALLVRVGVFKHVPW
jgi:hypothetical protein